MTKTDSPRLSPIQRLKRWAKLRLRPTVNIAGVDLPVSSSFSTLMQDILYAGLYEEPELTLLDEKLERDDIVVEVGAGLGFLSAFCAKRIGSDRVFTYEANPAMEAHIRRTYQLNSVEPRLRIGMLGAAPGTHEFFIGEDFWSSSASHNAGSTVVEVPVFDAAAELEQIKPTFLVMDIEGGEYELLKCFDFGSIQKVLVEVHPRVLTESQLEEVYQVLEAAGFSVVSRAGRDGESIFLERKSEAQLANGETGKVALSHN